MTGLRFNFGFFFCIGLSLFHISSSSAMKEEPLVYHGVIKENALPGDDILLDKPLYVRNRKAIKNEEICGYTIYKSQSDLPFRVELIEPLTGSAKIVLSSSSSLDFEKIRQYKFEIAAHDCTRGAHTPREVVDVRVEDVNDNIPHFSQGFYTVDVEENRIYGKILRLEAHDEDASEAFSKICHYKVTSPDMPFRVDDDGYLRNTEPLDYTRHPSYALEVVAEDCAGAISTTALININVTPMCRPHWTGVQEVVEFSTRSHGRKVLFPTARLDLCGLTSCNTTLLSATVKLTSSMTDEQCDVDRDSLESRRKSCGSSAGIIDLLPTSHSNKSGEGREGVYVFDGKTTAVSVPVSKLSQGQGQGLGLGRRFTISTWMKHGDVEDLGFDFGGDKENIFCLADGEGMNRHHVALTLHNCRLIFLLRQDSSFDDVDMSRFIPAEWRWKLKETCDDEWHHYTISVEYPEVRLYIDGQLFAGSKHNPDIIDDWPLHPTTLVKTTKLAIGACWQGRNQRYAQFFKGELAEVSVQLNETSDEKIVHCLNQCRERLDFNSLQEMTSASSISMSSDQSSIVINAVRKEEVESLLHRMIYVNNRLTPSLGRRQLTLETRAICSDEAKVSFEKKSTVLQVVREVPPSFVISAAPHILMEEEKMREGVKIFPHLTIGVKINSSIIDDDKEEIDALIDEYELSSCLVQTNSHMNLTTELITYAQNFVHDLGLRVEESADGLVISGANTLSLYEDILRGIKYTHKHPEDFVKREFIVSCTEDSGRYVTNKLNVELDVIRQQITAKPLAAAAAVDKQAAAVPQQKLLTVEKISQKDGLTLTSKEIGVRMAMGILACVGLMILLAVLGAVRMRGIRDQSKEVGIEDKQEMEWDNSALTITVNPMESELMYGGGLGDESLREDVGDESEEEEEEPSSARDLEAELSEPEGHEGQGTGPAVKTRELEWDDSTLTYPY